MPPALTDGFWEHPDIRTALADRHFGRLLRAYRKTHVPEVTQANVARWLGLTQGQVSRIERSAARVHDLDKLDSWARALQVPQLHLWFTLSQQPTEECAHPKNGVRSPTGEEGNDVQRRQFLTSAGVGAVVVGASLLQVEPTRPTIGSYRARHGSDVEIREMTQTFRRLDNRYGGGHGRTVITSYLRSTVEPLLKDGWTVGASKERLLTAAAEMHQLAGWMCYDTGQAEAGRHHLRQALRLCEEAGDDALASEMLAGMSHHAAFHGAPESAVDLAIAARQTAKRIGLAALHAEAAVMEAHGFALQGDKRGCLNALRNAEQTFGGVNLADVPAWLSYFDHAYLAAKFAHAFRDLAMPREAEAFARRSLEMSEGYERGRLFNTALLASTLADQGRVEEACAIGIRAVRMTGTLRSVRSSAYMADVGRRLMRFRTNGDVRNLYEHMAEAGLPTPRV
jgi:transcriptional regulator with XRE-family HTH domain